MTGAQVHFEVFARRKRQCAVVAAAGHRGPRQGARIGRGNVRLRPDGGGEGLQGDPRPRDAGVSQRHLDVQGRRGGHQPAQDPREVDETPLCITPQDLYSMHARERIGRLLGRMAPAQVRHRLRTAAPPGPGGGPGGVGRGAPARGAEDLGPRGAGAGRLHPRDHPHLPEADRSGGGAGAEGRARPGGVSRPSPEIGGPSDPASGFEAAATRLAEGDADPALSSWAAAWPPIWPRRPDWSDKVGR